MSVAHTIYLPFQYKNKKINSQNSTLNNAVAVTVPTVIAVISYIFTILYRLVKPTIVPVTASETCRLPFRMKVLVSIPQAINVIIT